MPAQASGLPAGLCDVAVLAPVEGSFTYRVGPELAGRICSGARVLVPFGRRRMTGIALGVPPAPFVAAPEAIRDVIELLDPVEPAFPQPLFELLRWTSDYYLHPLGQTFRAALPARLLSAREPPRAGRILWRAAVEEGARAAAMESLGRARAQAAALAWLLAEGPVAQDAIPADAGVRVEALRALERRGLATRTREERLADPFEGTSVARDTPRAATRAQAGAIERIGAVLSERRFGAFLLHGATGSGKTEVYLRVIAGALERGAGALVLVPEIALTPQLVSRFRARFGDRVAVQHSGLTDRARGDQWRRIRRGDLPIVIGARSAVFAPLPRVGVVIVDEEHEGSYKQEEGLPYQARDVAVMRAKIESAVAVLGSATPSLESIHNAQAGRYEKLLLPERVLSRALPKIEIIDMRREKPPGARPVALSGALRDALRATVARGEQAILFLNRRGFATQLFCRDCGHVFRCPNCDISLVLHTSGGLRSKGLRCHACDFHEPRPGACPGCGGPGAEARGIGTQQVEEETHRAIAGVRTARLDRDTVERRGAQEAILARLRAREVDVLVGTQMVAKGHDYPGVTLVGVIAAESSLWFPDFRATERTFQLLTQVAGRAGRGDLAGVVLIQTHDPDNPCLARVRAHDDAGFYAEELAHRRDPPWPPFCRLVNFRITASTAEAAEESARRCAEAARDLARADAAIQVLGPAPAVIPRVRNRWRWQVLLKGEAPGTLRRVASGVLARVGRRAGKGGATLAVDVDPAGMI